MLILVFFTLSGLDVAINEALPSLSSPIEPSTTFHTLARELAPGVDPSAAMCLVAAAAAAAARCSGGVATAVGSVLMTPQPLTAAEMVALVCFDIEQQLQAKLGRDGRRSGGRALHILSHVSGASGEREGVCGQMHFGRVTWCQQASRLSPRQRSCTSCCRAVSSWRCCLAHSLSS